MATAGALGVSGALTLVPPPVRQLGSTPATSATSVIRKTPARFGIGGYRTEGRGSSLWSAAIRCRTPRRARRRQFCATPPTITQIRRIVQERRALFDLDQETWTRCPFRTREAKLDLIDLLVSLIVISHGLQTRRPIRIPEGLWRNREFATSLPPQPDHPAGGGQRGGSPLRPRRTDRRNMRQVRPHTDRGPPSRPV